ncbi:hypothetical protein D3Z36_13485 [Lachnospiraceae bacterium]|nr:hypothetical protein [Lachnospiraceae bacterium]
MERLSRVAAGILAVFAMMFLTGCTTEERRETAKKYQPQYVTEDNGSMDMKAHGQSTEDEELQDATEESNQEDAKIKQCNETMRAVMEAIRKDDAQALDQLQMSAEGQELARMAAEEGSYLYLPEGGTTGTGIGLYVFEDCDCRQWYYGEYQDGKREGRGIWYYASSYTEDGSLYKEVYDGQWKDDVPNGKGRQQIILGDQVDTDQKFKVKNGLFYGKYKIEETLEDGTVVTGKYRLKKGKYVTISDEELQANNFEIPDKPHLAIAFLYNEAGAVRSCKMIYAEDVTKGVKHFYSRGR